MKRNHFLTTLGGAMFLPLIGCEQKVLEVSRPGHAFKAGAGEGRVHGHIVLKGVNSNVMDVKISGKDNNGDLAIFEQTSLSPGRGTPLHIHPFQDEVFYVLEGEYYFQVGTNKFRLFKGDSIFLPRTIPHAWSQVAQKGKMLVIFQPAGKLEEFFLTMAGLDHEPDKEEIAHIFAAHDMEVVGPPLSIN